MIIRDPKKTNRYMMVTNSMLQGHSYSRSELMTTVGPLPNYFQWCKSTFNHRRPYQTKKDKRYRFKFDQHDTGELVSKFVGRTRGYAISAFLILEKHLEITGQQQVPLMSKLKEIINVSNKTHQNFTDYSQSKEQQTLTI